MITDYDRIDKIRLNLAKKIIKRRIHPFTTSTFKSKEDYGVDIKSECLYSVEDLKEWQEYLLEEYGDTEWVPIMDDDMLSGIANECFNIEVKTFGAKYSSWKRSDNAEKEWSFAYCPYVFEDINYIYKHRREFDFPTQEQIQNAPPEEEFEELRKNKRLYMLNAASGRDFKFIEDKLPKWYKMYNDEKSELLILFKDGYLFYSHKDLLNAFKGYCFHYGTATEEFNNKEKYWQFKAVFDLDKGHFEKYNIPLEIFKKQ